MVNLRTSKGYFLQQYEEDDMKALEVGEEVCIGLWHDEAHKDLELIPAVVTRAAYYDADCKKPGWKIETNNGVADSHSLYTRPEN